MDDKELKELLLMELGDTSIESLQKLYESLLELCDEDQRALVNMPDSETPFFIH